MKNLLNLTTALVICASPVLADGKLAELTEAGVIQMGVASEPPYSEMKPDGTLTGADPDVARAIFAELGEIELSANVVDWGALIPGLMAGRFDAVATGLFIRPERCQVVKFSDPVLCTSEAMIVGKGNPKGVTTYQELVDSDALFASVAGAEVTRATELGMPADRMMIVSDIFAAIDLLKSGRVDVIGFPDVTLIEAMKQLSADDYEMITAIEGEPIQCSAAAFSPSSTDVRDFYDAGMQKLKDSGQFAEILTSYGFDPELPSMISRTELCGAEN